MHQQLCCCNHHPAQLNPCRCREQLRDRNSGSAPHHPLNLLLLCVVRMCAICCCHYEYNSMLKDLKDMETLSELGVLFLLYEQGLELSLDRLKVCGG